MEKVLKTYKKLRNDLENITGPGANNVKAVKDKILTDCYKQIEKISGLMTSN